MKILANTLPENRSWEPTGELFITSAKPLDLSEKASHSRFTGIKDTEKESD